MHKVTFFVVDKLFGLLYYTLLGIVLLLEAIIRLAPYAIAAFTFTIIVLLLLSVIGVQ